MRPLFIFVLAVVLSLPVTGQADSHGNPVFNSIVVDEKEIHDCVLISNYYTLANNIENSLSSVFVSNNPSLNQIQKAATNLASDFFVLTKDSKMIALMALQEQPKREFMILEIGTNKQRYYPSKLKGSITEKRAKELVNSKIDSTANINKGVLTFNAKDFSIISDKNIERAVLSLIENEKLYLMTPSEVIMPSPNELKQFIVKESGNGGQLDFFAEIQGHENDGIQIKPGLYSTKIGTALYKWGRACFDLGVNTEEDAFEIFSALRDRQLTENEKDHIKFGFYRELEKEK